MKYSSPPDKLIFYAQVWEIVRMIPPGRVSTYGKIAGWVPIAQTLNPQSYRAWGARWVGGAMANCPEDVPWQRVVNSQGKISLPANSKGYSHQKKLLEDEGIIFNNQDVIDLKRFGWNGPA
ncbi:MAG: cysteine methyltransferase [Chloroflexi bacterium]|nr:cysteine methyltransferase [Chloroflexota bacterium]